MFRRDAIADDIREELTSHLDARAEQYEREGFRPADARRKARQRFGNLAVHQDRGYDQRGGGVTEAVLRDLRWAWRGVRARGWRAAAIVALLGVTLAANAVVFAAADTFVFRTIPYSDPDRLVVIQSTRPMVGRGDYLWRDWVIAWRRQRDLFAGVEAHYRGQAAYVTANGITEPIPMQDVTPGLFGLLGVMPERGRPFTDADAQGDKHAVVIITDGLARRLFGSPSRAIGQTLETGYSTPTVIGVMPSSFRFPTAREEIWEPLDLSRWPDRTGVRHVARLAPGQTVDTAVPIVQTRLPIVLGAEAGRLKDGPVQLVSLADFRGDGGRTAIFGALLAAAGCLLLIACANVVSLELADAGRRIRVYAIRTALGASRASLIRVTLFEAALLPVASAGVAVILAWWGTAWLTAQLTTVMRDALANPLDLDLRALGFMVVIAAGTWLLTAIPTVLRVSRATILTGLRDDPRVMPVSRQATRICKVLMTGQVALTVALLVGALLYIRTYQARVGRQTGLDSAVATIEVFLAPEAYAHQADLASALADRLRVAPGVVSFARTTTLPPSTDSGVMGKLHISGSAESPGQPMLSMYRVDPEYFRTMSIIPQRGQFFDAASPDDAVVIDEAFANRYWPNGDAVGSRFGIEGIGFGRFSEIRVVAVSHRLRADRAATPTGEDVFVCYLRMAANMDSLTPLVVKIDNERRLGALTSLVRSVAPRSVVRVDTVAARYARLDGDTRLAAAVTTGFGAMALLVATCGIYAVMAFLVAGRSREIGIRLALGADAVAIRRMVFRASLGSVAIGAAIGLGLAALLSRLIASQLFGVSPTDPLTYAGIGGLVMFTGMAATWWPARRASTVDPTITLRAE